jgi:hypothetical protein
MVSGARPTKWSKYSYLWLVLRTPPKTPYIYNIRGLSHGCRKNVKIPLSVTYAMDTPKTPYIYNIRGLSHRCRKNVIFQNYSFFLHPWLKSWKIILVNSQGARVSHRVAKVIFKTNFVRSCIFMMKVALKVLQYAYRFLGILWKFRGV